MKLLYHSAAPWVNTGYGRVTRELVPRLQNRGIDIAIQCMDSVRKKPIMWHGEVKGPDGWEIPLKLDEPIEVYPSSGAFGLTDYEGSFEEANCDLHFTHFDTWMEPAKNKIPDTNIPYVSYVIVDHQPAPKSVVEQVSNAHGVIGMSEFSRILLEERGLRPYTLPHGVDTDKYYPIDEQSGEEVESIEIKDEDGYIKNIDPDEKFIVGIAAANHGDRKNIPNQMRAFNMFRKEIDEEPILYLHTDQRSNEGYDLRQVQKEIGIPDKNILWTPPERYGSMTDEEMNNMYNIFDVLLNCSFGESWGLTITEAQAAGTPCIVTNFSSMPEQLGVEDTPGVVMKGGDKIVKKAPHGLLVEPSVSLFRERVSSKQYVVGPERIVPALKLYYKDEEMREEDSEKATEFVRKEYDWDENIAPTLEQILKTIGERV